MKFITLSYNHSRFIIQHLESIRFVINKYSRDEKCDFCLLDDSSEDNTVALVNQWIQVNHNLFDSIDIITNSENIGVANNFANALELAKTERYKILAGDDLYFDANVFQVVDSDKLVLTPSVWFNGKKASTICDADKYARMICNQDKGDTIKCIRKMMRFGNCINAPGAFLGSSLISKDLISHIRNYTYIEDYPMWTYLLKRLTCDKVIRVDDKPYILYRTGSGISTKKTSDLIKQNYYTEVERIERQESPILFDNTVQSLALRLLNLGSQIWFRHFSKWFNSNTRMLYSNLRHAAISSEAYLNKINRNADLFNKVHIS